MPVVDSFRRSLAELIESAGSTSRIWVAYSGGADSTALLALTHPWCLDTDRPLTALHVVHGLHPDAEGWADHCQQCCERLGIDFQVARPLVRSEDGQGPEDAARRARYRAFEAVVQPGDMLLLAHHQQDQAETLLLRLLRGAGMAGMAAIPRLRRLGPGWLGRPLLDLAPQALRSFLAEQGLDWIDDPSNQQDDADRNFLRNQVLPVLEQRWPASVAGMARAARHLRDGWQALEDLCAADLETLRGEDPRILDLQAWRDLPAVRRPLVLHQWLRDLELPVPGARPLQSLMDQALTAREDAELVVAWEGAEVRRYRESLFAMEPLQVVDDQFEAQWSGDALVLPSDLGELRWEPPANPTSALRTTVRFRQGGERIKPHDSDHTRELKTLFQEAGIPPWRRGRIPLLFQRQQLVAVGDLWMTGEFLQSTRDQGVRLVWQRG